MTANFLKVLDGKYIVSIWKTLYLKGESYETVETSHFSSLYVAHIFEASLLHKNKLYLLWPLEKKSAKNRGSYVRGYDICIQLHDTANGCQTFEIERQNIAGWLL